MLHEHGFDIRHTVRTQKNLDEHSVKDQTVICFYYVGQLPLRCQQLRLGLPFVSAVNSESAQRMRSCAVNDAVI